MVSATGVHRDEGFQYALDNGAWTAHQQGCPWDRHLFEKLFASHGRGADFVVVPDVVADADASMARTMAWLPRLVDCQLRLIAVQDGMMPADVASLLDDPTVGIFVGGSTEWKLRTLPMWGAFARCIGCYLHVGRVNTARRILRCQDAGADSFDGTSASRFSKTVPRLDGARRQLHLWGYA
jgi:hypothetical protein